MITNSSSIHGAPRSGKIEITSAGTPKSMGSVKSTVGIYVTADPTNAGSITVFPVGGNAADNLKLYAGDSDFWPVDNLSDLQIDGTDNGDVLYWKGAV